MGVVNITPDSFSDGGRFFDPQAAIAHARQLADEGAEIIDMQYHLARKLLEDNRDKVEAMTKALLEFETIDADQIGDIMAGKPPRPPKPSSSQTRSKPPASDGGTEGAAAPAASA